MPRSTASRRRWSEARRREQVVWGWGEPGAGPQQAPGDGVLGVEVLRDVKQRLDSAGIMNPGKLLPTG